MEIHVISSPRQTLYDLKKQWTRLASWVDAFHLRFKELREEEVWQMAQRLLRETPIPARSLVINRYLDVAESLGAGGVHLTEHQPVSPDTVKRLQQKMRVGRSVHSIQRAMRAEKEGVDYLFAGHIFPSSSKPGLAPFGLKRLEELVQTCSLPVIAIGGIGPENVSKIRRTGVQGVAVISSVAHHPLPEKVAKEMKSRWNFESC